MVGGNGRLIEAFEKALAGHTTLRAKVLGIDRRRDAVDDAAFDRASIGQGQYAVVHLIIDKAAHGLSDVVEKRPCPVLTGGVLKGVYGVAAARGVLVVDPWLSGPGVSPAAI